MYLKLAFRNARRSIADYLLYIFSMVVLTSVICLSNCIANWGDMQAGFETMSLPLLIVVIMVLLITYINMFIVKQRAKEFATYMLLGMKKGKLSLTFLCELSIVGIICFLLGLLLGIALYVAYFNLAPQGPENQTMFGVIVKSSFQTLSYFCIAEILSILFMRRKIYKLQIIQLMREKQRNQLISANKKSLWGWIFIVSFLCYVMLLYCISFMSESVMSAAISVVAIPALLSVFSFYKWLYAFLASIRLSQAKLLHRGNRLYRIAEMTTSSKTNGNMNTIFSICLIFSAASFTFGTFLFYSDIYIFEQIKQQWMGFLQIGICIIFMVIYFSITSLWQIIDLKRNVRNIQLLFYMGKTQSELKFLLCTQVLAKLLLPTIMALVVLLLARPFINYKLNTILPVSMNNFLLGTFNSFILCFFILYLCYFFIIYFASVKYIKSYIAVSP